MAAENSELLLKCLEFTKYIVDRNMMCSINIKMGEVKNEFNYNFSNGARTKLSPSQEKRNILRRQEFINRKVKEELTEEANVSDATVEEKYNEKEEQNAKKKKKLLKFKVAAHMRVAAQKVLETAVSKLSSNLSRQLNWSKEESQWDIKDKIDGEFSGTHVFEVEVDRDKLPEFILEAIKKNWKSDPFPAKLIEAWVE